MSSENAGGAGVVDSGTAGVVIVGAGQAGAEAATSLRQQGYRGRVVLVGAEAHPPYRRPPLSKTFLAGTATLESLYLRPAAAYEKATIELKTGARVEAIDRAAKRVALAGGDSIAYEQLVLATGGTPRTLSTPGADRSNVRVLRSIADVAAIRSDFRPGARLAIIGGGYIGLEVAAVATKAGLSVAVFEVAPRVLVRVASPEVSAYYERVHRSHGVDVRTGVSIERFVTEGDRATAVVLADGSRVACDAALVGVGLAPDVALATAAGLATGNGIVVDEQGRTSDPAIYACGDCAEFPSAVYGRRLRLESVQNAMDQARAVALSIVGKPVSYDPVPWFWSDQYELKLQMVGLSQGYDRTVVRGSMEASSFVAFYLKEGAIIAADAVNRAAEFMVAKQLVAKRVVVGEGRLVDESVALKTLLV